MNNLGFGAIATAVTLTTLVALPFWVDKAIAKDTTAPVHLNRYAGEVTPTNSASGKGNVGIKFLSVEQACLVFKFSDELLDPGDELFITVDGGDAGGFFNPGSEPQASRTFCWVQSLHPTTIADFLDGKAKLKFIAGSGSVTLCSVTLTISGSSR